MIKFIKKQDKKTILIYTLALVIPIGIMLAVLSAGGFFPFGEKSLFIMDMKGQYLEFYASLRHLISGDNSLFFSWSRSMGGDYMGLFAYYIASPLSFITLLFPLENLTSGIVVLTLLKIGLCGLSFAVYANHLWKKHHRETTVALLIFSVSYALISYNMVYSLCPMWMDGVILLPAILLGVEKILEGKKGLHYMLTLAALFISNYYTGYMVGIFTAIYLAYRILCEISRETWKEQLKKVLRFAISTVLAFGLSMPLTLPVVKDLMQGKLSWQSYRPDTTTNFEFFDLFGKFANGVYDSITNAGLPAIYCGFLMLLLALAFFAARKISVRQKAGALVILAFLCMSFYLTKLDIAWHGFQYPNWFPYRYAFVFSFFLIYIALLGLCAWKEDEKTLQKLKLDKISPRVYGALSVLLLAVISFELGRNGVELMAGLDNEFHYGTVEEYETFLDRTQPLVEEIQNSDDGFYRINQNYEYSKNDAMLLGYNGMTHYSSTFNAAINTLTPKLGIAQAYMWNSGYGSNLMLDSLFAVGYTLDERPVPADYTLVKETVPGTAAHKNESALSIAYSAPVTDYSPDLSDVNPYHNQNTFLNTIADTHEAYFTEYNYSSAQTSDGAELSFVADSANPVYLFMNSQDISWADVTVNDNWVGNYFSTETTCSLYLGTFAAGDSVRVSVKPSQAGTIQYAIIAQLHTDILKNTLASLSSNQMKVTGHGGGSLQGEITVNEGQKIITSIPYSDGWTVRIDGEKVEPKLFADTFLAIETSPGDHEISFSYCSPGFTAGLLLLLVSVVLSVVYFTIPKSHCSS